MSSKVGVVGGGGSAGARKANNGIHDIPSGSRKIVQSLKEIVNAPEAEIYAMLKECNMDPNEAVNRLLSQDPFHEVKSKKEKKKETRDVPDYRPRGTNSTYNRGGARGGSDRYAGRGRSTNYISTDSGNFQGKSTNKKESGTQGYTAPWSSASGVANHHQTQNSDSVAAENKSSSVTSGDGISSSQLASGHQTAWFGAPGQRSMADIVKMGIPQNKPVKQNVSMRSEISHEHEISANQQVPVRDEWPSIEKPLAPRTSVSVAPAESEVCNGPADFQSDRGDQHLKDRLENIHLAENDPVEHVQADSVQEEDSAVSSEFDDPYQTQSHRVEHHKDDDDVSSRPLNFQQLTIDSHDQEASHEEDRPAVVIPNHLLIHTEECSQLSFGSFGGFGSRPLSNNVEETSDVAPPIEHSDARNTEYYGDEHLEGKANENMVQAPATENYDDSLESRREVLKQEISEGTQEHQYTFSQSEPGYAYENAKQQQQQMNTAYDASQTNAQNQMQNLASLSNMMGYTHSVPSNTLLAQTVQNVRELEYQFSPFSAQSLQSRNSNNASSLGGQSISMPESLRGSGIPATQPTQQTLPGANIATGPALPQQLPMHPYSQPTLPLTHYANMISYPIMPQNYPYMPSAFQQTFGNSSYHQQLSASLLPQYKTNVSPGNLPQSATAPASAYGFGNSTNAGSAGNFPPNQQSAPTGTTLGYEDVLSSQYKESNHLLALQQQQQQQNENSAMWHHGHGSRTMSGVPANTYYNLQAQQQLHQQQLQQQQLQQQQQQTQQAAGGYRQAQQQQHHYGSHGYPNFYQSQTEMSLERQQQNPRDGGGSQAGQQSNQTQQLWQNSY
ncbi:hypothetical protein CARUB_v10008305mg [Capsella rubella]|uniref:GBF-interacting protein 1 N-terminal domain-containing protein n=1 Tax=Capsella rubella TaxID=81985 RepID=R0IB43_9BRAS|nr:alpha-protein kinase 1 isoform X2 [Capsella rubella]EOA39664.1 hypothetical protein CARUB_v10008305mg [Capsella rubella]